MLKELRADFVESADSEGVRGLFRCAWRRLFLSDTTEDIIVVTRSQGLFTQLVRTGRAETAIVRCWSAEPCGIAELEGKRPNTEVAEAGAQSARRVLGTLLGLGA